jgi:protoheme IX farnesyltransferase
MVIITAGVGAVLAARGNLPTSTLANVLLATGVLSGGAGILNHWMERESDKRMRRTARRPLPAGRIDAREALVVGCLMSIAGLVYLYATGTPFAASLGFLTLVLYVCVYTPLKPITEWNTIIGAVPGALPVLIGWAMVRPQIEPAAWTLFALLFVWQFPHFLAIAWLYREDYAAAGLKMFPSSAIGRRYTNLQAMSCCCLLLAVSVSPPLARLTGPVYFWGAFACGVYFLAYSLAFLANPTPRRARYLMFSSLVYLPAVLGLLVLDMTVHP